MIRLIRPTKRLLATVKRAIPEYQNDPAEHVLSVKRLIDALNDDFKTYFQDVRNNRFGIGLKKGYVPSTELWLMDGDAYIGSVSIRHYLNKSLEKVGGHIAGEILPSYRGKGIAKKALRLSLSHLRRYHGVDRALVTCKANNIASSKTLIAVMKHWGGWEIEPFCVDGILNRRFMIQASIKPFKTETTK
ncbi:MAG: GNAT family N-acetyltransferase [Lactobacillales bacterium]|jgi:predicted acetyltransferase|nr:GNAT family N-acetyltransferase [Lactobacillales bacterium]